MTRALPKLAFALVLSAGALGAGSVAHADKCVPDPNAICPFIVNPVICNDGVTYTNQCFADAACAKGCRPAS